MITTDFLFIIPELYHIILLNLLLLFALFFSGLGQSKQTALWSPIEGSRSQGGLKSPNNQHDYYYVYLPTPLQMVGLLGWLIVLSLLLSIPLYLNIPANLIGLILTSSFICDDFARIFKIVLTFGAAAAICLAIPAHQSSLLTGKIGYSNYESLILVYLAIFGMLCLISSYNFLSLYLSIELQSLCFYLLASSKSRSEFSAEAGLKYFILGAFSSSILLFGICLIYGTIGSIYFDDIGVWHMFCNGNGLVESQGNSSVIEGSWLTGLATVNLGVIVGLSCICISLLFKLAAVPFHMWAPDVYEGSPMGVTAFFAIAAKVGALAVLARLIIMTGQLLQPIIVLITAATLLVGTFSAMRQIKLKRFIAFSGISNVGWFLMGLSCGQLEAVILHLIVYIVSGITLFSITIQPIHRLEENNHHSYTNIKHISDLGQIYKTNKVEAVALTLTLFSLGGIPLLAGFYSKYLIINAAVQAETLGLLSIGLFSAVLSAFYYIRVVKTIYFARLGGDWFSSETPSNVNAYLIAITSFFTALFIIYPESFTVWLIN